jgi:hypothetical protein
VGGYRKTEKGKGGRQKAERGKERDLKKVTWLWFCDQKLEIVTFNSFPFTPIPKRTYYPVWGK